MSWCRRPIIKEPVVSVFLTGMAHVLAEMPHLHANIDGNENPFRRPCFVAIGPEGRTAFFDNHSVFIDDLILPRMNSCHWGRRACWSTQTIPDDIWLYATRTGDGVADAKELFYTAAGTGAKS